MEAAMRALQEVCGPTLHPCLNGMVDGVETDEWTVQGNSVNKWYQSVDGAVPTRMDQGNFRNDYDRSSFRSYSSLPASFFTPPAECHSAPKCKSQAPCIYG